MSSNRLASLAGLLLAAGNSSRLGQSKQSVIIHDQALLQTSLLALVNGGLDFTMTVLGANAREHFLLIKDYPSQCCENVDWKKGIGSSIKYGLQNVLKSNPTIGGVLISVCDQPFLTAIHIHKMVELFNENNDRVIVSDYGQSKGVPVIFPKAYFDRIANIPDHLGAKNLLPSEANLVLTVYFERGDIDLDTPEDLEKLLPNLH